MPAQQTYRYFFSFASELLTEKGHFLQYHTILQKIASKHFLKPMTFVPVNCSLQNLPSSWEKTLFLTYHWRSKPLLARVSMILANLVNLHKLSKSFSTAIKKYVPDQEGSIFFFETFNTFYLLALIISLVKNHKKARNIALCFLYRYEPRQLRFKGKKDPFLLQLLSMLTRQDVITLTDTEPLSERLSKHFKKIFHVLPIPHTEEMCSKNKSLLDPSPIVLWWPGGARVAKGLQIMQKLAKSSPPKNMQITLKWAIETGNDSKASNLCLEYVSAALPRELYIQHFYTSHFILLPYREYEYRSSSSGIFIEAIMSASCPLTTPGTWMAKELMRYDLQELIIDFSPITFFSSLAKLINNAAIFDKLAIMRAEYSAKHTVENFGFQLGKILANTRLITNNTP